jgi:hypothetical protein
MLMRDLLNSLDTPETPYENSFELLRELGLDDHFLDLDDKGFTTRVITTWLCTDTWVGHGVIYYEGDLICMTEQECRKCDVVFKWVDQATYDRIQDVVRNMCRRLYDAPAVKTIDWDQEISDPTYNMLFASEIVPAHAAHAQAMYQGQTVKVLDTDRRKDLVQVTSPQGAIWVPVDQLRFPIKLRQGL